MLKQKGQQDMGMVDGMLDPYKQSWEQGRYGEMAGRAVVDIGMMFLGGGGRAGAASKADDVARAAGSMDDVGRTGGANPYGKTLPGPAASPGNPYGSTLVDAPTVNPYGKTLPGPGAAPANPYGPTLVDAPSVNPYGKTLPGGPMKRPQNVMEMDALPPDYVPGMPQPPGWKAGPYGSHGPAPVDPLGTTLPGASYGTGPTSVKPPAPSPTQPALGTGPVNPTAPTMVDAPPISPYGKTQPGMTPISPTAPTMEMPAPYFPSQTPTLTGMGPVMHPTYPIPGMGGAGGNSILSTWDIIKSLF
jgi:hypothetical protein